MSRCVLEHLLHRYIIFRNNDLNFSITSIPLFSIKCTNKVHFFNTYTLYILHTSRQSEQWMITRHLRIIQNLLFPNLALKSKRSLIFFIFSVSFPLSVSSACIHYTCAYGLFISFFSFCKFLNFLQKKKTTIICDLNWNHSSQTDQHLVPIG